MDYIKVDFYNTILNGNIPFSVLECFKGFKEVYNNYTLINHPYLKIRNENILEFNILSCDVDEMPQSSIVCKQHIKKSLNLNRNMIVKSLQILIKNILIVLKTKYEKEIILYKTTKNDAIINKIYGEFAGRLLDRFKNLRIDRDTSDVFLTICLIISLVNLNTNIIQNLMFKLVSQFELNTPFMINQKIGVSSKYLNKFKNFILIDQNIDIFSLDLAEDLLQSIEYVLNHMMTTTSKNKICGIYIMAINIADSIIEAAAINTYRIVETILNAASDTTINTSEAIRNLKDFEKTIKQNSVIEGMNKLVTDTVTQVFNENKASLIATTILSNKINISNTIIKRDVVISNAKQTIIRNSTTDANIVQNTFSKINLDVQNKLTENIFKAAKNAAEKWDKSIKDTKEGSNVSEIANIIADMLKINIKSDKEITSTKETVDSLIDKLNLDQSFEYKKNLDNNVNMEEVIKNSNISDCLSNTEAKNDINVDNVTIEGNLTLPDSKQEIIINDIINCVLNQTTVNDISKKILNEFENLITQMADGVDKTMDESQQLKTKGDIYAVGVAAKQTLEGVGDAAKSTLEGGGELLKGAGSFLSSAALLPAIILGGVLFFLVIGYIVYKKISSSSSSSPPVYAPPAEVPSAPEAPSSTSTDIGTGEGSDENLAQNLKYIMRYMN